MSSPLPFPGNAHVSLWIKLLTSDSDKKIAQGQINDVQQREMIASGDQIISIYCNVLSLVNFTRSYRYFKFFPLVVLKERSQEWIYVRTLMVSLKASKPFFLPSLIIQNYFLPTASILGSVFNGSYQQSL